MMIRSNGLINLTMIDPIQYPIDQFVMFMCM